ncbi:unnamed protein product [Miscanthus lutarioriparius]|uniref:CCHC-type domain-containing protein n=1 Tax=Miscanthus lutarioriparius TaxID=422564 RepID=A0A811QMQ7_9POAL|nr:unnamed protein product [Miscanthus lutarioriparius]
MAGVEGLLENLRLSEAERKSVCINLESAEKKDDDQVQAVGKLLSEKWTRPEIIEQTVGWIWCPVKGIECKDLGENIFLFSFNQASELLVVADFDGSKSLDEIDFSFIPIWPRISRLPMGMMNKAVAMVIGNEIGKFMEVDFVNDDLAAGRFLHLKVRLDIRKPLMRGTTVNLGEGKGDRWCPPITYEFLPDFCYICGIIGHTDKLCSKKIGVNDPLPFSKDLPSRRRAGYDGFRGQESPSFSSRRRGGFGSRFVGGSGSQGGEGTSRSDVLSWRKEPMQISLSVDGMGAMMRRISLLENSRGKRKPRDNRKKDAQQSTGIWGEGRKGMVLRWRQEIRRLGRDRWAGGPARRVKMKIIVWNCRGLGNGAAVQNLLNLQKEEDPDIMFLSETKMVENRIKGFRWKLGLTNMVAKDCVGSSGGLAIFWRKEVDVHVRMISNRYIDADVKEVEGFLW